MSVLVSRWSAFCSPQRNTTVSIEHANTVLSPYLLSNDGVEKDDWPQILVTYMVGKDGSYKCTRSHMDQKVVV